MDNKKWYNRFATIFWWGLTILPLIIALIQFIGYHFTFNSGISVASDLSSYHNMEDGDFFVILSRLLFNSDFDYFFENFNISYLQTMFNSLFNLIGLSESYLLAILFGWMVSVQFYHLLFDFIVWLPQWFHRIMEKGMDKLS